jgi:hypothetical protein
MADHKQQRGGSMVPPRVDFQPIFVIAAISRRDHMPFAAASTKRLV